MTLSALGIDVSKARRLDVVAMDGEAAIVWGPAKVAEGELAAVVGDLEPGVIAIDSPPEWAAAGKSRAIELQLARMGIHAFPTPAFEHRRPLHEWMEAGFRVFEIVKTCGYPLYRGDTGGFREAIEVFPHASAVALRGTLPAIGLSKQVWRRRTLLDAGVDTSRLMSEDALDAALAALTGLRFLQGRTCVIGQRGQAVLVLPVDQLPNGRYVRDTGAASEPPKAAVVGRAITAGGLCLCGCGAPVRRRYLPGHDAKHRSQLAKAALAQAGGVT